MLWVHVSLFLVLVAVKAQALGICNSTITDSFVCNDQPGGVINHLHRHGEWAYYYLTKDEAERFSCVNGRAEAPCRNLSSFYISVEYEDGQDPVTREYVIKDIGCGHLLQFGTVEGILYHHYVIKFYKSKVFSIYICSDHLKESGDPFGACAVPLRFRGDPEVKVLLERCRRDQQTLMGVPMTWRDPCPSSGEYYDCY